MVLPPLTADAVSVVTRGSFNPAIFSPAWLLSQKLIGTTEYEASEITTIQAGLANFKTGWLGLTVTNDALQVQTDNPDEFERCRDVAAGILQTLHHSPISHLGINRSVHFAVSEINEWHVVGDALTPKEVWEGVIDLPGMRLLNIQGVRPDNYAGRVHIQIEPSQIMPRGIFVSHNDHYGLKTVERQPANRSEFAIVEPEGAIEPSHERISIAVTILVDGWAASMRRAEVAIGRVAELRGSGQ